jgi:hypothetical protein
MAMGCTRGETGTNMRDSGKNAYGTEMELISFKMGTSM